MEGMEIAAETAATHVEVLALETMVDFSLRPVVTVPVLWLSTHVTLPFAGEVAIDGGRVVQTELVVMKRMNSAIRHLTTLLTQHLQPRPLIIASS